MWNSGGSGARWVQVDLQGHFDVTSIVVQIARYPKDGNSAWTVQTLEDGVWRNRGSWAGPWFSDGTWVNLSPRTGSYPRVSAIRITGQCLDSWVALREIYVGGSQSR
ncbi:MAG: hypothetical protein IPK13_09540 [Deltaproteobacteria bacterium]|nr:hypothetical protein [Deltaproteobacteria bacterium]